VVETSSAVVYRINILPGRIACFRALLYTTKPWTTYSLGAPTYQNTGAAVPKITVIHSQGAADSFGYTVVGTVRNDEKKTVEEVSVVGALYNAGGTVLDCDWNYAANDVLAAGKTSTFDLPFTSRTSYADVARYYVEGDGLIP
jgi:hypothetical protein